MSVILEVRDLRKHYGRHVALDGVSLQVHQGERFGLLGPNGAGKTTLLSIVSGLMEPSAGEVYLDGKLLRRTDRDWRRQLGIVPQELAIYNELTARENVRFFGELYHFRGQDLDRRVAAVLSAVGLTDHADQRADTFSGGMKRRLNLGTALVHGPRLLLLDEPTTGVDPQSRNHIFESIRQLNDQGVTIVYTSHYMEEVESLCPRVGILDHGRLIACDLLTDLLRQLDGLIRFKVPEVTADLGERLAQWTGVRAIVADGRIELFARNVKSVLVELISLLNELKLELTHLEMIEPNLERVFLHLTGRALRDSNP